MDTSMLLHWENYTSNSFHIEWDKIVVTDFLSILNQMEIHLVQNRMENCRHDHIPFDVKGNGNVVFSVNMQSVNYSINIFWSTSRQQKFLVTAIKYLISFHDYMN